MRSDRMDEFLKELCQNDWNRIDGLKDIQAPDFNAVMDRFKNRLQQKPPAGEGKRRLLRSVWKPGRYVATAICLLVCSFLFSLVDEMPKVKALKFNMIRTFIEFKDGMVNIQQSNFDPNAIPKGQIPPPPEHSGKDAGLLPRQPEVEADTVRPIEKTLTLERARKEIPFPLLVPKYLPQDFQLKEVRSKQFTLENYIVEQEYTDGKDASITIRQHSGVKSFGSGMGTRLKVKSIQVMGEDAILVTDETSYCTTSWYKDEFRYEITAFIPETEFMKMLESLAFDK